MRRPRSTPRSPKRRFALLTAGETVFLDASSTTFFLARRIAESGLHVRVLTNSLPVLYELSNCPEPGPEIVASVLLDRARFGATVR